jgi:hypothetical protein
MLLLSSAGAPLAHYDHVEWLTTSRECHVDAARQGQHEQENGNGQTNRESR